MSLKINVSVTVLAVEIDDPNGFRIIDRCGCGHWCFSHRSACCLCTDMQEGIVDGYSERHCNICSTPQTVARRARGVAPRGDIKRG